MPERRPPRVSVALCTYNGSGYLDAQLESILAGTAAPNEIIVSDDGSSDDTVERAERHLTGTHGARVLRNARPLGVTANFEAAIRATTGDIIVLADQDDVWEADRLAVALDAFDADLDLMLHHADARLIDADGNALGGTLFGSLGLAETDRFTVGDPTTFARLLRRNLITGATVAFRRSLLDAALPFPREWLHDEWLAIHAAVRAGIRTEPRPLVRYRQHGANQIGAPDASLRHKVRRVLAPDAGRVSGLAGRSSLLADRLEATGAPRETIARAQGKAAFEARRAALPVARLRRWPRVLRLAATGGYDEFASRGRWDVIRDLLQPRSYL